MADDRIRKILTSAKTIAVLGAHKDAARPAHYVPAYLAEKGYRILPVNPKFAGKVLFGEPVRADLAEITEPVDVLDVFRRGEALDAELEKILKLRPRVVWFQLGVKNDRVARALREAGIEVVEDRCMLAEHRRLLG